jgi:ribosome maturation factor RimP
MTQRGRVNARPGNRQTGGKARAAAERTPVVAPRLDLTAAKARVIAVIEPVVAAAGFDLEDVSLSRAGRRHVVRVLVDADGGINLDGIAVVSRAISTALDAAEDSGAEILAGEYQLEVSSPGVDRPLTVPRHWWRNVGRLVAVTVAGKSLTGRLTAADEDGIVLDERRLTYAELGPGRVQIEFKRLDEAEFDDDESDDDESEDDEDDEDGEGEER